MQQTKKYSQVLITFLLFKQTQSNICNITNNHLDKKLI